MKSFVIYVFLLLWSLPLAMGQQTGFFERGHFKTRSGSLQYRILYPDGYNPKKPYPVLTVLHGVKERGDDNEAQLRNGGKFFLDRKTRKQFEAIVIFPQCPDDSIWTNIYVSKLTSMSTIKAMDFSDPAYASGPARMVKLLLDSLIRVKVADPARMYLGGLSMGGYGVFSMLPRYPRYFAAAFAICGGGDTRFAARFARTCPVWIFHGSSDPVVNVKNSRNYYAVLKKMDADVRYTEYPGVGHNSWDHAFAEPGLLPWLLSKRTR